MSETNSRSQIGAVIELIRFSPKPNGPDRVVIVSKSKASNNSTHMEVMEVRLKEMTDAAIVGIDPLAAIHEAGHGVMSYLMRRGPLSIRICQAGEEIQGVVESITGLEPDEINEKNVRECVLVALAGPAAEILQTDECPGNIDDDVLDALETLRLLDSNAELGDLVPYFFEAQKRLATAKNWGFLLAVSQRLIERRYMDGEDFMGLVRTCKCREKPPYRPRKLIIERRPQNEEV